MSVLCILVGMMVGAVAGGFVLLTGASAYWALGVYALVGHVVAAALFNRIGKDTGTGNPVLVSEEIADDFAAMEEGAARRQRPFEAPDHLAPALLRAVRLQEQVNQRAVAKREFFSGWGIG